MEEILSLWSSDLDRHVSSFLDQSVLLAQWDDALLSSASTLQSIQGQVTGLQQSQLRLNKCVDVVQTQQKDLNAQLDQLEAALDAIRPPASGQPDGARGADDVRREETYRLAEEVDEHLSGVAKMLADTVAALNEKGAGGAQTARGGGTGMWAQLTDILNVHQQSMQWLDRESEEIERALSRVGQDVSAVKHSQNGHARSAAALLTDGQRDMRR